MDLSIILVLFMISIGCMIMTKLKLGKLENETDKMSSTQHYFLKQCKNKFAQTYDLNKEMLNINIFVDKSLSKLKICGCKLEFWSHLAGQCLFWSILCCGIFIFKGIIEDKEFRYLIPYYIIAISEVYVFFSIASVCDSARCIRQIKLNMLEYFEHHMKNRLVVVNNFDSEEKKQQEFISQHDESKQKKKFDKNSEKELEQLLQEFLM